MAQSPCDRLEMMSKFGTVGRADVEGEIGVLETRLPAECRLSRFSPRRKNISCVAEHAGTYARNPQGI